MAFKIRQVLSGLLRQLQRDRDRFVPLADEANLHDDKADDRIRSLERFRILERLELAVDELPDDLREVIDLLHYEGLKQEDAAALLGISVRQVKRRWQKAKLELHRIVKDDPLIEAPHPEEASDVSGKPAVRPEGALEGGAGVPDARA